MAIKLYSLSLSHPAHSARLMLEHKGIEHEIVDLLPGFHPLLLHAAGFRGGTVPALRIDGRRIQGTLRISRALDELRPDPPLFPSDPEQRRNVEEAEAWGERDLQPIPRRFFRWAVTRDAEMREWIARDIVQMPAPRLMATLNLPVARYLARRSDAYDAVVRADLAELPATLDRVDDLIERDIIGQARPNAADFQIATSVRILLSFPDLFPLIEGRPAEELARRTMPDYVGERIPFAFPAEWIPAAPVLSRPGR